MAPRKRTTIWGNARMGLEVTVMSDVMPGCGQGNETVTDEAAAVTPKAEQDETFQNTLFAPAFPLTGCMDKVFRVFGFLFVAQPPYDAAIAANAPMAHGGVMKLRLHLQALSGSVQLGA
jgi:hypothetical protein